MHLKVQCVGFRGESMRNHNVFIGGKYFGRKTHCFCYPRKRRQMFFHWLAKTFKTLTEGKKPMHTLSKNHIWRWFSATFMVKKSHISSWFLRKVPQPWSNMKQTIIVRARTCLRAFFITKLKQHKQTFMSHLMYFKELNTVCRVTIRVATEIAFHDFTFFLQQSTHKRKWVADSL